MSAAAAPPGIDLYVCVARARICLITVLVKLGRFGARCSCRDGERKRWSYTGRSQCL